MVPEGDDHETALEAAKEADAAAMAEWRASLDAEDRKRGFVIDGFPNSFEEAAALEKALTGLDPAREEFVRGRVSIVAPMREHEVAAKATPTFISGLDAVVVLELPTEPDAQAATRRGDQQERSRRRARARARGERDDDTAARAPSEPATTSPRPASDGQAGARVRPKFKLDL